jgi:hypothetical protein
VFFIKSPLRIEFASNVRAGDGYATCSKLKP